MGGAVKAEVRTYQNYVNGEWVGSASGETFAVYDPSTEEIIAQVASANAEDVDRAVKAARAAFDSGPWGQTNAAERGRILFKLAEKIRQNARDAGGIGIAAIRESRLWRRSTTLRMWRPALSITADWPTKFWAM